MLLPDRLNKFNPEANARFNAHHFSGPDRGIVKFRGLYFHGGVYVRYQLVRTQQKQPTLGKIAHIGEKQAGGMGGRYLDFGAVLKPRMAALVRIVQIIHLNKD